jgi:hypothetical protein
VNVHDPVRPSWRCRVCDEEWPCRWRRRELTLACHGSRVSLALMLAQYFGEAAADRPDIPASVLYARFLGWLRTPP